ncbi:B12-binding domain-containing radical SAM protein [Bdellovibrionota bacterium]
MATKSLLITFSGYPYVPSSLLPDNGLAQLAACLVEAGHETTILDFNTPGIMRRLALPNLWTELRSENKKTFEEINRETSKHFNKVAMTLGQEIARWCDDVDWIGFKVWNGDGYTGSVLMAEEIKRAFPNIPIIAGGPHVDWFEEFILEKTRAFDFLALAEGETMIVPFAQYVEGKRSLGEVPNLILRDKSGSLKRTEIKRVSELGNLPIPLYDADHYPAFAAGEKIKIGVFEETRGCPVQCYFCAHPVKSGIKMRKFPVEAAVEQLKEQVSLYGFRGMKLAGSFTPCSYLRDFTGEMLSKGMHLPFTTYGHMNNTKPEDFAQLKEAGCFAIFFGVESGDQLILDSEIRKRYKANTAENILKKCKEAGIFTVASLIYPNLNETPETKKATLDLMRKVKPDSAPCHFPMLLPNTPWANDPEKFGFKIESREHYLSNMLTYKARLMFPPEFWEPLPYKMGTLDFEEYAKQNAGMVDELEALGIITLLSDENALIANLADIPPREFRDQMRDAFIAGDADFVEKVVKQTNG